MYKVSDLLGKPVISLCGDMLGTIGNIFFDGKAAKATYIKLYTEDDESVYLPMSELISLENDAVVASSTESAPKPLEGIVNPVNLSAFDGDGRSLGTIKDIVMDGVKIVSFDFGETSLPSGTLISTGKVAVFNDPARPIKTRQTKRRQKRTVREIERPAKTTYAPSYDFLIGKKLQRNILTPNGRLIAREGENVTDAMIEDAKKEGKLVVLALNSL